MRARFLPVLIVGAIAFVPVQGVVAKERRSVGSVFCEIGGGVIDGTRIWIRDRLGAKRPSTGKIGKGCYIAWNAVADTFSPEDKKGLSDTTEDALEADGKTRRQYVARDSKATVTIETSDPTDESKKVEFVLLQSVSAPPKGVRVVGKPYRTTVGLNLRSSPDQKQKENIVGTFAPGETVAVMAVTPDGWALIGSQGFVDDDPDEYAGVGYASMRYLADPTVKSASLRKTRTARPKAAASSGQVSASGGVKTGVKRQNVQASTQCKTVSATTGKASDSKRGCASPSGRYEIV